MLLSVLSTSLLHACCPAALLPPLPLLTSAHPPCLPAGGALLNLPPHWHCPLRAHPACLQVMPYSTGCSTALSNFEAGQNYKDVSGGLGPAPWLALG